MDISDYGIQHLQSWAEKENLKIDTKIGDILANFKINSVKHTEYCSLDTTNNRKNKYYYVSATLLS